MKTVLITGGNSGLGYETAKMFLKNGYQVIVTCRNDTKKNETVDKLKNVSPFIKAIIVELDNLENIRYAVEHLSIPIDVLICNAGMAYDKAPIRYTKDGIEETFGVNHLAHFYLTNLLLLKFPSLNKILIVSSNLHSPELSKGFGESPDLSDLKCVSCPEKSDRFKTEDIRKFYANSKLCNVLFGYELQRRNQNKKIIVFNPGFMPGTNLPRYNSTFTKWMLKNIFPLLSLFWKDLKTPDQSASIIFQLIDSDETIGGKYWDGLTPISSSKSSYDLKLANKLWDFSNQLIK